MAWKDISSTSAINIKKQKDVPFIGIYQGNKKFQTKIGGKDVDNIVYKFLDEEGEYFAIYGFTNLDRIMENAKEDLLYKITYTGTKNMKTPFGMKDVHQCKVEVDEEPESEAA